jgi:hypothetical protein
MKKDLPIRIPIGVKISYEASIGGLRSPMKKTGP